jgi:hypothetical protein
VNEARDAGGDAPPIVPGALGPSPDVETRAVSEYPGYFITRTREVWSSLPRGKPRNIWPATGPHPWRRLAVSSHHRRRPHVFLNRDGRKCFVAVDDIYEAAFPPLLESPALSSPPPDPPTTGTDVPSPPTAYRPVAGFPGYFLTPDRSVWSSRQPGGDLGNPASWRPVASQSRRGGPPFVALHRDGHAFYRSINSLYRATYSTVDLMGLGPESRGSAHHFARLDEAKVIEARRLKAAGSTYPELVERFGVGRVTLFYAISGRTWSHVPIDAPGGSPSPAPPATPSG